MSAVSVSGVYSGISSSPSPQRAPIAYPLAWLLALAVAHVIVRIWLSSALKWDEAEQILWAQHLALGYGAQPPLYTWLQWCVDQVFGPSVLALALLKHVLLVLAMVFMYKAARVLLAPRGAWLAAAGMLLLPPLGWDLVADKTHTALAVAMCCGAWWLLLRIVQRPRPADFAWLGLVCGMGMLAKYSFALVAAAMLLAALSVPEVRRALRSRGWWLAPLAGLLTVLPHAVWLASHLREASAETLTKMEIHPDAGLAHGLLDLLGVSATTLGLWLLIALWAFGRACWRRPLTPAAPWAPRLFGRYLLLVVLALLGMVLFGVTNFKTHWMGPLLCMAPLAAFAVRPELQEHQHAGRYTGAVVAMALLALLAAGVRPWASGLRGHVGELNHSVVALSDALRAAGYDGQGRIVAADHMLAGMLRTRFPHAAANFCTVRRKDFTACITANMDSARRAGQGWLLISRDDRIEPDWWDHAAAAIAGLPPALSIDLPLVMVRHDMAPAHYRYVWQPAKAAR